jgi:hypothetical protein
MVIWKRNQRGFWPTNMPAPRQQAKGSAGRRTSASILFRDIRCKVRVDKLPARDRPAAAGRKQTLNRSRFGSK